MPWKEEMGVSSVQCYSSSLLALLLCSLLVHPSQAFKVRAVRVYLIIDVFTSGT